MSARLAPLPRTAPPSIPGGRFYAPSLPATDGGAVDLADRATASHLVLFFMPGPEAGRFWPELAGCVAEAAGFRDRMPQLARLGVSVFGLSLAPIDRLRAFAAREALPYLMLSDYQRQAVSNLDIPLYAAPDGATYAGRTTLLVRRGGGITERWDDVVPEGHADAVLRSVKRLR